MTVARFIKGFNKILSKAGDQIRVRYFYQNIGSIWDDDVALAISGTDQWISGVILPIDQTKGSRDQLLFEQGLINTDDKRVFLHGSIFLSNSDNSGSDIKMKMQIGSPTGDQYSLIPEGGIITAYAGTDIYRKAFVRKMNTGSFIGE